MTKNTKIALGCGGGGCLGLILLVIVGVVLVVTGIVPAPGLYNPSSNSNYNYNSNRNSNYNANINSNTNDNLNSNSDSSSSSSTMSEDDKHKLFQAAGASKDSELILKVLAKIGFPNGAGDGYAEFLKEHYPWARRNTEFMQTVNTPEKGRAYAEAHLDD
ncbi:MAG: hypothetical protein ACR2HX_01920 [Pyrinomonadaceae bacterium]